MTKRIGVIGAGAAGLSAAWRLAQAGASVVVHERSPVAGGLLCTEERNGLRADVGVQLLSSTYAETFALAAATGARELLVRSSGRDALWRKGSAHGITYGSVTSMVASAALPTLLKLKLGAKYVPWLSTRASHLDVNALARTGLSEDGESIAQWGRREIGEDFVEYLSYPLLAAYYGTPPEGASAALYHGLARVGMDVKVYAMRGGAAAFAASLAAAVARAGGELRFGDEVGAVHVRADAVELATKATSSTYDAVIVATPPAAAAGLLRLDAVTAWLRQVRIRPAVAVTLWLKARANTESFGFSFPRREPPGDVIVAACVQSHKPLWEGNAGDAIVAFPAPAFLDYDPSDAELLEKVPRALARALPGVERHIGEVTVTRMSGYRQFAPGHIRRLANSPVELPARLALAGDYMVAPTVEGAVRSGAEAAARLLRQLQEA